jgi:type I restriction enzyme M protein
MFVSSIKFVERHNGNRSKISVVGQERIPDTWRLAKMNLAIRGISHNLGERPESTFAEDLHKDKKVDFIMANPPFNLKLNAQGVTQEAISDDVRWDGYPTPPVSNANYAWILHMLSKLDVTNGIAGFLLANGALNADGIEGEIRKGLVENDKVEAIIVLPREMFYSTDISVTLWILNNNKKARLHNGRQLRDRQGEVLFIDLRRWNENTYEKNTSSFRMKKSLKLKRFTPTGR